MSNTTFCNFSETTKELIALTFIVSIHELINGNFVVTILIKRHKEVVDIHPVICSDVISVVFSYEGVNVLQLGFLDSTILVFVHFTCDVMEECKFIVFQYAAIVPLTGLLMEEVSWLAVELPGIGGSQKASENQGSEFHSWKCFFLKLYYNLTIFPPYKLSSKFNTILGPNIL